MIDAGTLLDFAARYPRVRGEVEETIRRELGVTPARYCQLLHRAAATMEGQAHDPITAHRILRSTTNLRRIRRRRPTSPPAPKRPTSPHGVSRASPSSPGIPA